MMLLEGARLTNTPNSQETARVNINILGISELKWTALGEFNSDDHYIYYWGKNPLEEMV